MKVLASVLLFNIGVFPHGASADAIPQWALGRWIAVASIETAAMAVITGNAEQTIPRYLSQTQIQILSDSIAASHSPYNPSLAWGIGLTATLSSMTIAAVLEGVPDPSIFGESLEYDPRATATVAKLSMELCGRDGGYFIEQVVAPIYRFAKFSRNCSDYSILHFPDQEHIAMVVKRPWGATRALVIFKRVPADWIQ